MSYKITDDLKGSIEYVQVENTAFQKVLEKRNDFNTALKMLEFEKS